MDYTYCCLNLPSVSTKEVLAEIVREYALSICRIFKDTETLPEDLDLLGHELNAATETDAVERVTDILLTYLRDVEFTQSGCSLLIVAPADRDNEYSDIVEPFTSFLFSRSGATHFLMRSAAFDRDGGYSHHWIGYWKGGSVVVEHCDSFFQQLFSQGTPALLQPA
jgi:hypothetical protein